VGIIELEQGPMITGLIIGEVEKIKIGDKVEAVYIDEAGERVLAFKVVN
jgi:uncharacterized OB-fold protein